MVLSVFIGIDHVCYFYKGYILPPAFTSGKRESVMIVELERNRDTLTASILKVIMNIHSQH